MMQGCTEPVDESHIAGLATWQAWPHAGLHARCLKCLHVKSTWLVHMQTTISGWPWPRDSPTTWMLRPAFASS